MRHAHVDATLTQAEREAPFAMPPAGNDPLPPSTRAVVVWDGDEWTEIDAATGAVLGAGRGERR